MKRILLLFCVTMSLFCSANTIHWVTFIDTTDPTIGVCDANARQFIYSQWINKVNAALAPKGYLDREYDFYGTMTTPENCKQTVMDLQCSAEDIVVFYYMGHGGRSDTDSGNYPQMLMAQNEDKKCIPLMWVHNTLKAKNPRLLLTVGMCCNSFDPSMTPKEVLAFCPNSGVASGTDNEMESIRKLFLCNSGDIIMSSSSIGQPSYAFEVPGMTDLMDIFTYRLVSDFNKYIKESENPSWHTLLGRVSTDVNNLVMTNIHRPQTPQCDITVTGVEMPDKKDRVGLETDDLAQKLTDWMDEISDPKNPLPDRINLANQLKTKFAANAYVRMLAEDSDLVVDKMLVSDYLDIVATSKNYYKIKVVSANRDGTNPIDAMRVREYIVKIK